jgi:SPP1 gp7 family putative phage head morphogenesis protein
MKGLMVESGKNAAANLDVAFDVNNAEVVNFVEQQTFKFADSIAKNSSKSIQTAIKNATEKGSTIKELRADLKDRFVGGISDRRADMIARTETIRAANEGARAAYKSAGVTTMRWVASTDACVYCQGLDGKVVSVESNFLSQGDEFIPDGATKALDLSYGDIPSPPAHPNCRCTIIAE